MLQMNLNFLQQVKYVPVSVAGLKFTTLKTIPHTSGQIMIAIRSGVVNNQQKSFLMAFDHKMNVLMKETEIPGMEKYNDLEFLPKRDIF